jgi:phosphatidylserine/phosphatidylglycerophosphate/cardiolipin synthase-like enzyme
MTLKNLTAMLDTLEEASLSFESLAGCLRFLHHGEERSITTHRIAEVTGRPVSCIEPVVYRLKRVNILDSETTGSSSLSLSEAKLERFEHVIKWATTHYDRQTLEAMADLRATELLALYTVPSGADVNQRSNMTGQLLDMTSNASERVSVVVPFFSDGGVDTIAESLAAATGREVDVEMLTRDITMGNEQNHRYIQSIRDRIQMIGDPSHLSIFEFNREQFPDSRLHAKMLVADSSRAYVGSANMTESSLRSSLESGVFIAGRAASEIAAGIEMFIESDLFVDITRDFIQ